ncbi:MAG: hypothetical protein ACLFPU_08085 [Dehalococcoidia bacterium]
MKGDKLTDKQRRWCEWVRKKIEFYISTDKWDSITIPQLNAWIAHFGEDGEKCALALLNHFIYYSALDVRRLCRYALTEVLFKSHILEADRCYDFRGEDSILQQRLIREIEQSCIIPILEEGNPTESGNQIARIYTTTNLVEEENVLRPDQLEGLVEHERCKRIIFVDDFMGSGDQLVRFWNEPMPQGKTSLCDVAQQHPDMSFEYIALVGTSYGLQRTSNRCPGLRVHFVEELSSEYQVFGEDSIFFSSADEQEECYNYLESLCYNKGIHLQGYHDLDFALAFNHGTPDCSLPVFWEKSECWDPLFKRRM